ncbi:hypothetical protein MPTK1_4g02280 [Marchantia polymorpha subsp. ruderalis]|uniref:Uncharacterized protein n=2 Tax=Marchantia polymorpha TaxID=3197 RepID=A0AAF6B5G6_MARPO|nr:hypothetical protein MARPO_0080s0071 [Marchantia polymorpha]BBN07250.1 hypothetical protein Mp_4g02280 [Marchantia polymorpha subsp. ruderalis]|eukprot:PTQ34455.1 hypothetical protein MARPO_0080s0071 [Marchantia polymorpha]
MWGGSMVRSSLSSPLAGICSSSLPLVPCRQALARTTFLGRRTKGSLSQSLTFCKTYKAAFTHDLKNRNCRASLPDDAPFALAIGACLLSTLVLPNVEEEDNDKKENSLFGPDDMRSGAMQIISFIPLFNWLVWIFAWLDSGKQRYLAFAIVYLAPYLKTGLSLNPEDSWLPLASVLACIAHVQLDLSVTGEGSQPPLIDVSKLMLEKSQFKDLRARTEGLVGRLKELAERTDVRRVDEAVEGDEQTAAEWKAIQEEKERDELKEFDEKLARSRSKRGETVEEVTKEIER